MKTIKNNNEKLRPLRPTQFISKFMATAKFSSSCEVSIETREKKSVSMRGRQKTSSEVLKREKIWTTLLKPEYNISQEPSSPFLARKHSDETRAKLMGNSNGKNPPQDSAIKIEVLDLETNISTFFNFLKEASKAINIQQASISNYFKRNQQKPAPLLAGGSRGRYVFSRSMSTLYAQKITKIPVKNLANNKQVSTSKHFPVATSEWHNSVYTYNPKSTISFLVVDQMIIKIITSYFNSFYLEDQNKNHFALVRQKIHSLYMNKVYVGVPELKHTNSKIIITLYIYCDRSKNLEILYKHLESNGSKSSLAGRLSKLCNKIVVLRVIQLRYLQLNSSILAQYLADTIAKGGRSPLVLLRRAFRNVIIPKINLHSLDEGSSRDSTPLDEISTINVQDINKSTRNEILLSTHYKRITGLRVQIAGRLNRRSTAARSVVKTDQVGYLKNIDSSSNGLSVGLIRGHIRPNLDKAYCNSKTRNGAFNVRVWTSSFYSTLASSNKIRP